MTFAVKHTSDEAIVIVTIDLPVEQHLNQFQWLACQIDQMVTANSGPIYCILDLREMDVTYSDVMLWIEEHRIKYASMLACARVQIIPVGEQDMLRVAVNQVKKRLGIDVISFHTMEDAVYYAQTEAACAPPPP